MAKNEWEVQSVSDYDGDSGGWKVASVEDIAPAPSTLDKLKSGVRLALESIYGGADTPGSHPLEAVKGGLTQEAARQRTASVLDNAAPVTGYDEATLNALSNLPRIRARQDAAIQQAGRSKLSASGETIRPAGGLVDAAKNIPGNLARSAGSTAIKSAALLADVAPAIYPENAAGDLRKAAASLDRESNAANLSISDAPLLRTGTAADGLVPSARDISKYAPEGVKQLAELALFGPGAVVADAGIQGFDKARSDGLSVGMSGLFGGAQALTEGVPEAVAGRFAMKALNGVPMRAILSGDAGVMMQALRQSSAAMGLELTTEQVSALGNWYTDKLFADPTATPERLKSDLADAFKATLIQGPTMIAGGKALQVAANALNRQPDPEKMLTPEELAKAKGFLAPSPDAAAAQVPTFTPQETAQAITDPGIQSVDDAIATAQAVVDQGSAAASAAIDSTPQVLPRVTQTPDDAALMEFVNAQIDAQNAGVTNDGGTGDIQPQAAGSGGRGSDQPAVGLVPRMGDTDAAAPAVDAGRAGNPSNGAAVPLIPAGDTTPAADPVIAAGAESSARQEPEQTAAAGLRVLEVPVAQIKLSNDVPQFKSDANADGVVEPLGGKFERTGVAPIQVWRRINGELEVISGRHRLDLARRSGEATIPAQIHNEADGFDAKRAASLDAELNIRDGQGKVRDYISYFQSTGLDKAEAESRGLLARATGKRAYIIAVEGDESLIAAHRAGQLTDEGAVAVAHAAPGDGRLQAVGIRAIADGRSISQAVNMMHAVKAMASERPDTTGDMFGFDDSAMREAEAMAKIATAKQRSLSERLSAMTGAAKRPELAKAEGIDVKNPDAVLKRIKELQAERSAWDSWSTNPELIAQIRAEMPAGMVSQPAQSVDTTPEPVEIPAEIEQEPPPDTAAVSMFDEEPAQAPASLPLEPQEQPAPSGAETDMFGQAPSATQQEQINAAPDASGFELGMQDSRTGDEVAPGQAEIPDATVNQETGENGSATGENGEKRTKSPDQLRAEADLMNALGDLGDILNAPFRANITPEQEQKLLPVLTRVMDAAFRLGYIKFKDAAKFALDKIAEVFGAKVADLIELNHLQGAYIAMAGAKPGADTIRTVSNVEDRAEIESHTAQADNAPKESSNVPSTDVGLEPDRNVPAPEPAVGNAVSAAGGTASAGNRPAGVQADRVDGGGRPRVPRVPPGGPAADGERGDQLMVGGGRPTGDESLDAGADFGGRGGDDGVIGVQPSAIPASKVEATATSGDAELKRRAAQRAASSIKVEPEDLDNIRQTLPYLLPEQQDDVHKAEKRFGVPDGYGMLFTNGTGTGKTFSGLGIVKRFAMRGKANTLIVVPDEKIASDWVKSGVALGLEIRPLSSTKDSGSGISIATYANLGSNDSLALRNWDLVVADEAHSLTQSADAQETSYLSNLRAITHHPDGMYQRYTMLNREDIEEASRLDKEIVANSRIINNPDTMDDMVASLRKENEELERKLLPLRKKLQAALERVREDVRQMQGEKRSRAVFLSATPFAYEKTIDWANGYLFDYNEGYPHDPQTAGLHYNQPDPRQYFFMTHLGYQMRYNKLTEPDGTKVDRGLLQRQFNTWLKKRGSLSGRMLDVPADYDRRFVLINSAIGNRIDEALEWLSDRSREEPKGENAYGALSNAISQKFDYLSRRYLLEAIKATEVIPIVRAHMAMGRKVVVFHDYKKGGGFNPFAVEEVPQSIIDAGLQAGEGSQEADAADRGRKFNSALQAFEREFADLISYPFATMPAPIEVFRKEFPDVLLVNGNEKKADLLQRYAKFQDDASGPQVMLVQSAKNKGWSGHDTTGKHQRVLINLGQPTAPTLAIQQEGRIYRTGQVSNAIMRYLNTGTNWEKWAFASTIAGRASTAENLGMGELSRALKDAFISAFEESDAYPPGHDGEGTGGKERDKANNAIITEYDRAKTLYWATQKRNSSTKSQEGKDYFATPEPVGLKMVEWLDARPGEDALEPSAGHGAIARWISELNTRTVIEPSLALRSRLAMAMNPSQDKIINGTFEDHHVVNKYHGIVMNPPFGVGGKTAIEHLAKANEHLRDGGRIVALIPTGPAADARFEKWFYGKSERKAAPLYVDPNHGPIYRGDTLTLTGFGSLKKIVVDKVDSSNGARYVRDANTPPNEAVNITAINKVEPTGPRTEQYEAAKDLHLVAEIKLPQSTFGRAGTSVSTRIMVLEKQTNPGLAPSGKRVIDLSEAGSVNELFDRMEDIALPKRSVLPGADAQAQNDAGVKLAKPGKAKISTPALDGDTVEIDGETYTVTTYTTNAGKELRGVWLKTKAQALKYGRSTFEKKGLGFFLRDRDFPKGGNVVREPEPAYNQDADLFGGQSYETDLFGAPVPRPAGKTRNPRPASTGLRGDAQPVATVQDTPAPSGEYLVNTIVGTETKREVGANRITNAAQAATATKYLYKSAVERFDGIVTDKDGRPLAVIGGFKGGVTSTSVDVGTIVAEAVRVPGAAHIWFSHNHPSGAARLSQADIRLNATLYDLFEGSGIKPIGLLAVTRDGYDFVNEQRANSVENGHIKPPTSKVLVPVIDRELADDRKVKEPISSPTAARSVARLFYQRANEPGIILLDAQMCVSAWVPLTAQMTGRLRDTGGLNAIYRAISQSNASAGIIVHGGELGVSGNLPMGLTPSENIAAAMAKIDVRPIDSINVKTGKSVAESAMDVTRGPVFSRSTDLLDAYDPEDIKRKQEEEAQALKQEQQGEKQRQPAKRITADQVDLFNPQGSLFSREGVEQTADELSPGDEFWRKIRADEPFTDQELTDAYSIGRRGTKRTGRPLPSSGAQSGSQAAAGRVFEWAGEVAGFSGYRTLGAQSATGKYFVALVPNDIPIQGDGLEAVVDSSIVGYLFTRVGTKWRLDIVDPAPDTPAFNALDAIGRIEPTGQYYKDGTPYYRTKLDDRYTTNRVLMQEAVRRLAIHIGEIPTIIQAGRDTGARAVDKTVREFSPDTIASKFNRKDGADASQAGAQSGNTQPTDPQALAAVDSLNNALRRYFGSNEYGVVLQPGRDGSVSRAVEEAIRSAFGKRVVPVAAAPGNRDVFNGFQIPGRPDDVFVNVNARVGFVNIAGHELWHSIERQRPDLITWYRERSRGFYKDLPAYRDRLNALLQPGEKSYTDDKALSELEADFLGDSLTDRDFLQSMADASPSKFKALLTHIRLWLDKVLGKLKDLGSTKEVTDVQALRGYLKDVLVAFADGKDIPQAPDGISQRAIFSRTQDQTRTPQFKAWFGNWELARNAAIINGRPVASVKTSDVPAGGYHVVEDWADDIFKSQGGKAVRAGFGEVTLDRRAAKTSMAHGGANRYKKAAFAAVKDVIERGALVLEKSDGNEDSFYFSAPVEIDGRINIETVLVHRDPNTHRMYLHSVTTKENLLNQRVSSADAEASERSGSTNSGGVGTVLQNLLNFNGDGVSKVVDADGRPLVVYHGTTADVSAFDLAFSGSDGVAYDRPAIFASDDARVASDYALNKRNRNIADAGRAFQRYKNENPGNYGEDYERLFDAYKAAGRKEGWDIGIGANVLPIYLSIQNPLEVDGRGERFMQVLPDAVRKATEQGRDGVIARNVIDHASPASEFPAIVYVAFRPEQVKSATGNNGNFDPTNPDIRYSRARPRQGRNYILPGETVLSQARRKFQDYFLPVLEVQNALLAQGGTITEASDVYRAEERSFGRVEEALRDFRKLWFDPMIQKAQANDVTMDELSLYAYAKHAMERNAYIATIRDDMPDNGSGMSNEEAADILARIDAEGKTATLEDLHGDLMAITAATRRVMLDEGLISQDRYDAYEAQYEHYVPLRGFEMVDDEGSVSSLRFGGHGFNIRGEETIRALGRRTRAGDIIENIALDYERAVYRGERNQVAKSFLELIRQNPDPALWGVNTALTKAAFDRASGKVVKYTKIDTGPDTIAVKIDGREVYLTIRDERLLRAMRKAAADETGSLERFIQATSGQFIALIRKSLTQYNPVFSAVNAVRDFQSGGASVLDTLGAQGVKLYAKHYRAALAASGRYYTHALGKSGAYYGDAEMDRYFEEYRASGGTTGGFYGKTPDDLKGEIRNILLAAGAAPKGIAEKVKTFGGGARGRAAMRGVQAIGSVLEFAGSVSENAARVSAYRAARELGKSPAEAASIAKNLTNNFNRKGEWGQALNGSYMFFNAAIQGSHRTLKALKNRKVQGLAAGLTALGATSALMALMVGGDDEDDGQAYWDKIPAFEKERNFIIMLPPKMAIDGAEKVGTDGRYIKVPMPYGFNVFPVLGTLLVDAARYQKDKTTGLSPAKAGVAMLNAVMGSFNPIGGAIDLASPTSIGMAAAPTMVDIGIQLAAGVDAFNRPTAPYKGEFDHDPDSENVNARQSGGFWHLLARNLNRATGGDRYEPGFIDVTPGTLENAARQITGGTGTFLSDVFVNLPTKMYSAAAGEGADITPRDVPFLRNFYGMVDGVTDSGLLYERRREIQKARSAQKNREDAGVEPKADSEGSALAALASTANRYTRAMSKLRQEEIRMADDDQMSSSEKAIRRKELKAEREELSREFNREFMDAMRDERDGAYAP